MKQGIFGPIARSAQEVRDDILALSGLDPDEVAADNFEEEPGAVPPVARWTCDVREVRTFEVVGQIEADAQDDLLGILEDAGIRTKEGEALRVMLVALEEDGTLRAFHEDAMDPADSSVVRKIALKQLSRVNGISSPGQFLLDLTPLEEVREKRARAAWDSS